VGKSNSKDCGEIHEARKSQDRIFKRRVKMLFTRKNKIIKMQEEIQERQYKTMDDIAHALSLIEELKLMIFKGSITDNKGVNNE
jgi:RNase P subunit RPR2